MALSDLVKEIKKKREIPKPSLTERMTSVAKKYPQLSRDVVSGSQKFAEEAIRGTARGYLAMGRTLERGNLAIRRGVSKIVGADSSKYADPGTYKPETEFGKAFLGKDDISLTSEGDDFLSLFGSEDSKAAPIVGGALVSLDLIPGFGKSVRTTAKIIAGLTSEKDILKILREEFPVLADSDNLKPLSTILKDESNPNRVQKIIDHAREIELKKKNTTTRYWYDNLPKPRGDEQVVAFVETKGGKQYVNTNLADQKLYDGKPHFGIVKKAELQSTGIPERDAGGVRLLDRNVANRVVLENVVPIPKRVPIRDMESGRMLGSFMDDGAPAFKMDDALTKLADEAREYGVDIQPSNPGKAINDIDAQIRYLNDKPEEAMKALKYPKGMQSGGNADFVSQRLVEFRDTIKKSLQAPQKRAADDIESTFDRPLTQIEDRLESIFGQKPVIKTTTDTKKLGAKAGETVYGRATGDVIGLLERNKSFSEAVANHEGWHWFKRNLSSSKKADLDKLEDELWDEVSKTNPQRIEKIKSEYGNLTKSQLAEELMADEFARFTRTGRTFTESLKTFFEKALESLLLVFRNRDDITKRVAKELGSVKKTLREEGGKAARTIELLEKKGLRVVKYKKGEKQKVMESLLDEDVAFKKRTTESYQRAESEVITEMTELSMAGKRFSNEAGEQVSYSSTFPKWIPSHLRSSDLFSKTVAHYEAGTVPTGSKQKELLQVIEEEISKRADEYEELASYDRMLTGEAEPLPELPKDIQQIQSQLLSQSKGVSLEPSVQPKQDAVKILTDALKAAKPLERKQAAIYSAQRARQTAAISNIGKRVKGEQGFFAQKGALKGEMQKVEFESVRKVLTQENVDALFNMVEETNKLYPLEKISAKAGLAKLIGGEGGAVPTKSEIALLQEVFPKDLIQTILDKRSLFERVMENVADVLNIPRAIMSSFDVSAPLRQGIFFISKPKQFLPAFGDMFKALVSEKNFDALMESIKNRPSYKDMREGGLALLDIGEDITGREERFMSNFAEKIPGAGRIIRASSRAYTGFLNKLRADVFDDLSKKARDLGVDVDKQSLTRFINAATGRGDLGMFNRAAPILNGLFFSPRLMASRLNLLNPVFYHRLDPFVRREALKSLIAFTGLAGTVLGLSKMAGADVETDPRSADFAKVKYDDTRYDILGGFQQYIRLASQLITGEVVSSTTGRTVTLGEGYKPLTRKDLLIRFFESKESPVASFVTGLLTGQDSLGRDFNLTEESLSRFVPLIVQDLYELHAQDKSLLRGSLAPLGVGTMTYGSVEMRQGKNKLGQDTTAILPPEGLAQLLASKVSEQPLATSKSFDIEQFYDQLLEMPKEQAAEIFDSLQKQNPELAKKVSAIAKERKLGITAHDKDLKDKGVASGDRAKAIMEDIEKLETKEEKAELWEDYTKKGIITKDVAKQLQFILQQK